LSRRGFILRHVLEHVENPFAFLFSIAKNNNFQGHIYIEVPSLEWILDNGAWTDIFYEHVNYFRVTDFMRIFKRVLHLERTFGGQYLSIVADLSSISHEINNHGTVEEGYNINFNLLEDQKNLQISEFRDGDCIWGCGSKGVIFSIALMNNNKSGIAIDINPRKQKKYLPISGWYVFSINEGLNKLKSGATIWVMNRNYLEEVRAVVGTKFTIKTI
jgi:hypothetical protein